MHERNSGDNRIGWIYRNDVPLEQVGGAWKPVSEKWPGDLTLDTPGAWGKLTPEGQNLLADYFSLEAKLIPTKETIPQIERALVKAR